MIFWGKERSIYDICTRQTQTFSQPKSHHIPVFSIAYEIMAGEVNTLMLHQAKRWMASQERYGLLCAYVHNDSHALASSPRKHVE